MFRQILAVTFLIAVTASHAANLRDVQVVPHMDLRGRAGYEDFLAAPVARAFVIAPGGSWAWRAEMPTTDMALEAALQDCRGHTEQRCVPNGHGNDATPDYETCHARFPHPSPPPEGEGVNESLCEFHANAVDEPVVFDARAWVQSQEPVGLERL